MENVESDPKTDRPKVCAQGEQSTTAHGVLFGEVCSPAHGPFCHQEEVRICTTTVFVDPYEEADAQVSKVGPEKGTQLVMSLLVRSRRTHPEALDLGLPSLLAGGEKTQLWGSVSDSCTATSQIAQERKKTQHQVEPEAKVKMNQPQPGNQGPQTYRQGVGKYINPAAT